MTRRGDLARLLRLIVITDEKLASRHGGAEAVVKMALEAGCRAIQLRMKDAGAREMLAAAASLRAMTRRAGALLFINDRLDVALAAGADGAHLGPDDLTVEGARTAAPSLIIGYSTDDPGEARRAVIDGADYIGCGTVYPTGSKVEAGSVIGLDGLDAVARAVEAPVVGVGGISPERAPDVSRTGATGVAVISAVMGAPDPASAVRALLEPFEDEPSEA